CPPLPPSVNAQVQAPPGELAGLLPEHTASGSGFSAGGWGFENKRRDVQPWLPAPAMQGGGQPSEARLGRSSCGSVSFPRFSGHFSGGSDELSFKLRRRPITQGESGPKGLTARLFPA